MEKITRITKSQRFYDIIALLNGEAVSHGTTPAIAQQFIEHEIELLAKKNAKTGEKKLTPKQIENEGFKTRIVEHLSTLPEDSMGITCTAIWKAVPEMTSNQHVSSLVRQLKDAKIVKVREVKGQALVSLRTEEDED